jgi:hypothetical protein
MMNNVNDKTLQTNELTINGQANVFSQSLTKNPAARIAHGGSDKMIAIVREQLDLAESQECKKTLIAV